MKNYAGIDYSTDSGTDSESEEGGEETMEQPQATEPNRQVEWIESKRNRPILLYGGHFFLPAYTDKSKECEVYRCEQHKSHCPGKVWIKEGRYHKHDGEHNHFADPIDVAVRKVIQKGKNELRHNPLASVGRVMDNAMEGEEEIVIDDLDKGNFRRLLSRLKAKLNNPSPKDAARKVDAKPLQAEKRKGAEAEESRDGEAMLDETDRRPV